MVLSKQSAALASLVAVAACTADNTYKPPPPPEVTVALPGKRDVQDYAEFTGSTRAYRIVEIRPRVQGYLAEIKYTPGDVVEQGDVLFQIDPVEFEAAVRSAEADLASAQADLVAAAADIKSTQAKVTLAEAVVKKLQQAYETRAVSQVQVLEAEAQLEVNRAEHDRAIANRDVGKARAGVAQAHLDQAVLDLTWTTISAPMRGLAAMWNLEVGALLRGTSAPLLTTIYDNDKIYCYFDISEQWILEARKIARERGQKPGEAEIPVLMALANETEFTHEGLADYSEPTVDPDTGTLRARAVFDNTDRLIPPGSFARVRIPIFKREGALMVSERAVGTDQSGSFLLIVNSENIVERRDVVLGTRDGKELVVIDGLKPEDRVIVSGLQRAREGAVVAPHEADKS